jgi:hypothetical protein
MTSPKRSHAAAVMLALMGAGASCANVADLGRYRGTLAGEGGAPDAGDAETPREASTRPDAAEGFCSGVRASVESTLLFCDDFDSGESLDGRWEPVVDYGGWSLSFEQPRSSPRSLLLLAPAPRSGDTRVLVRRRFQGGLVHVGVSVRIGEHDADDATVLGIVSVAASREIRVHASGLVEDVPRDEADGGTGGAIGSLPTRLDVAAWVDLELDLRCDAIVPELRGHVGQTPFVATGLDGSWTSCASDTMFLALGLRLASGGNPWQLQVDNAYVQTLR